MLSRIPHKETKSESYLLRDTEVADVLNVDINLARYIGERCGARIGNKFSIYYDREIIETEGFMLARKIKNAIQ